MTFEFDTVPINKKKRAGRLCLKMGLGRARLRVIVLLLYLSVRVPLLVDTLVLWRPTIFGSKAVKDGAALASVSPPGGYGVNCFALFIVPIIFQIKSKSQGSSR